METLMVMELRRTDTGVGFFNLEVHETETNDTLYVYARNITEDDVLPKLVKGMYQHYKGGLYGVWGVAWRQETT